MAPKKKKTKEEIEAERLAAEEAARIAEEERKKLEEEERKRLEELERQRQELVDELLRVEAERCQAEREEVMSVMGQIALDRARGAEERRRDWEWERYLSCTHVPHPRDRVAVDGFLGLMEQEGGGKNLAEALAACKDCYRLIEEATIFRQEALLQPHDSPAAAAAAASAAALHAKDISELHRLVGQILDKCTASLLHFNDELANEKGEVQVGQGGPPEDSPLRMALWVNTSKNPRMKTVEMPQIGLVVDIPKQVALASVSMRVVHRALDEFFPRCQNEMMAVGGVLYIDLLGLPPPAKKVKQWTMRQVTALASSVQRIPYPIPPAGADPATWVSEEEVLPIGFTLPFSKDVVLLDEPITVGWWDSELNCWSTEGISKTPSIDPATHLLSFQTTRLTGPLAVLQSRARLFPYKSWSVRPTGGRGGSTVAVSLDLGLPGGLLVIEAAATGHVSLSSTGAGGSLPQLAALVGRRLQPVELLLELSKRGLHLMPEDRDAMVAPLPQAPSSSSSAAAAASPVPPPNPADPATAAGEDGALPPAADGDQVAGSAEGAEAAASSASPLPPAPLAARDDASPPPPPPPPTRVALKIRSAEEAMCAELGLISSAFLIARSKWNQAAASDECIVRISEILDWDEGGRTEQHHLDRIFQKEKEDGDRRVLTVTSRREGRGFAFVDALDRRSPGPAPLPGHETVESVKECMASVWGEVHAGLLSLLKGPAEAGGSVDEDGDQGQGQGAAPAAPLASGGGGGEADATRQLLLQRLRATPEGLELAAGTNPVLSQMVGQLLYLLRVFSFS